MIFVCVGSREYQFDRLLQKLDELVENEDLKDKVFAQIGQSNYIPTHYEYIRFMSAKEFKEHQAKADLIISHGGTGSLIGALKLGKQIIAVPRLARYGEHIDDHQTEVAGVLEDEGYLRCVLDINNLLEAIQISYHKPISKRYDKPSKVIDIIGRFITEELEKTGQG